eukprot:8747065-Pyramimonas_sp.AAC.1
MTAQSRLSPRPRRPPRRAQTTSGPAGGTAAMKPADAQRGAWKATAGTPGPLAPPLASLCKGATEARRPPGTERRQEGARASGGAWRLHGAMNHTDTIDAKRRQPRPH